MWALNTKAEIMEPFKTCYLFDPETGVLTGEYKAQLSPTEPEVKDENGRVISEAVYIAPVHSTFMPPPKVKKNQVPRFSIELDAWGVTADFRGEVWYHKETGEAVEISEAGDPPEHLAPEIDPKVNISLAKAKAVMDFQSACTSEIIDGFSCDALGTMMHYPFSPLDQQNLTLAALAAMTAQKPWSISLMCKDKTGTWARVPHSSEQVIEVLHAAVEHRDALSSKMAEMQSQIEKAATIADVQKITW
jgi:hypothetical protein